MGVKQLLPAGRQALAEADGEDAEDILGGAAAYEDWIRRGPAQAAAAGTAAACAGPAAVERACAGAARADPSAGDAPAAAPDTPTQLAAAGRPAASSGDAAWEHSPGPAAAAVALSELAMAYAQQQAHAGLHPPGTCGRDPPLSP